MAGHLSNAGVSPNAISGASAVFAAIGAICIGYALRVPSGAVAALLFVVGVMCIQGRLLCNLFDGMVAVEGGKKTAAGEIWNELPDRLSDTFFFVGAGIGVGGTYGLALGLLASLLAMATAYVRLLGVSAGVAHDFSGPFAKQHRMFVLTLACIVAAVARNVSDYASIVMLVALCVIALGSLWTAVRRNHRIVKALEARS